MTVVLSMEPSSEMFDARVLTVENDPILISRSSKERGAEKNNAFFNCKVLSKPHAMLTCVKGNLYLTDKASKNGTFINSFRLSKAGQGSAVNKIYSKDILRFGSEIKDDSAGLQEKCIIARVGIFLQNGEEYPERPNTDKIYKQLEEIEDPKEKNNLGKNELSFEKIKNDKSGKQSRVEKLSTKKEKVLTKKVSSLVEIISKYKENEEKLLDGINDLEEALFIKANESKRVSDELNIKTEIEEKRQKDVKREREEIRNILEKTTEEICLLKEQVKLQGEDMEHKENELAKLNNSLSYYEKLCRDTKESKDMIRKELSECREELKSKESEVARLNELLLESKADIIRKGKEMDILNECNANIKNAELKDDEEYFTHLQETIETDKDIIACKDELILSLQHSLEEREEWLDLKTKNWQENEEILKAVIDTRNIDVERIRGEKEEMDSEIQFLNRALEEQIELNKTKDSDEQRIREEVHVLKSKMEKLVKTIEDKNLEIENIRMNEENNTATTSLQNEKLQKEILVLNVSLQQKDLDVKHLNEVIESKDRNINENTIEATQIHSLIVEKDKLINSLKEKTMDAENSLIIRNSENIKLKEEIEKFKQNNLNNYESENIMSDDSRIKLIHIKDEEIAKLKKDIVKEKQIISHVQLTQEKDIIEKDKQISLLSSLLSQEREVILEKEKEIERLFISKYQVKDLATENSDSSETFTYHDALSDEDDICIDDLMYDEDL